MAYEMVMPYHLHMPSYFLETFTEYPKEGVSGQIQPAPTANDPTVTASTALTFCLKRVS